MEKVGNLREFEDALLSRQWKEVEAAFSFFIKLEDISKESLDIKKKAGLDRRRSELLIVYREILSDLSEKEKKLAEHRVEYLEKGLF